ncbi:delta-60 repeat domain-containing protein [Arthrobacter sp. SAFR-044]|uniref:delta-60 repeat domain-containing protein n=1 Tax=Arthrobacter sp. SAFR-044 TaxID=3387278 RepID=UPI003F7BA378
MEEPKGRLRMSSGYLDETFGLHGGVRLSISGAKAGANAVTPSGHIVIGADVRNVAATPEFLLLVCLDQDGKLNDSFGRGGVSTLPPGLGHGLCSLAIKRDGTIMVCRNVTSNPDSVVLIDPGGRTFRTVHLPTAALSGIVSYQAISLTKLAITARGALVVGGAAIRSDASEDFVLAQFLEDGTLDSTFGNRGVTTIPFAGRSFMLSALLPCPDGSVLAVGTVEGDQWALAVTLRFDVSGRLDEQFGEHGLATSAYDASLGYALAAGLFKSGSILIAGYQRANAERHPAYASFTKDGVLMPHIRYRDRSSNELPLLTGFFSAVAIDNEGNAIVAGPFKRSPRSGIGIAKLDKIGDPDYSFGTDGTSITFLASDATTTSLAIDERNRILVSASTEDHDGPIVLRLQNLSSPTVRRQTRNRRNPEELRAEQDILLAKIQHEHNVAMRITGSI